MAVTVGVLCGQRGERRIRDQRTVLATGTPRRVAAVEGRPDGQRPDLAPRRSPVRWIVNGTATVRPSAARDHRATGDAKRTGQRQRGRAPVGDHGSTNPTPTAFTFNWAACTSG